MNEPPLPPSWDGSVVLDIGGDVGALVIRVLPELNGREIDLSPEYPTLSHTHSRVRERSLGCGNSFAAVYPALKAGRYFVEGSDQQVTIVGGQVVEIDYVQEPDTARPVSAENQGHPPPY